MSEKTCILVVGPTAVGKTALSIQLALHYKTAIISADSRQCFKELNIGVAKPDAQQLHQVKHYFISSHSITENVNAAIFEQYALHAIQGIFLQHDYAIMVGGTGLYIKAFCEGLDAIPEVDPQIRKEITENFGRQGIGWLKEQVEIHDPGYLSDGEMENPQRLMRTLEVKRSTGKSIRSFQSRVKKTRDFKIIKIGLELPRTQLYGNINRRVDQMIAQGLIEEVASLKSYAHLNALQTVGYTEIFAYLGGIIDKDEAISQVKRNSRHYAKRQITWFRKDPSINWFAGEDAAAIFAAGLPSSLSR